jgi:hypothetical protein
VRYIETTIVLIRAAAPMPFTHRKWAEQHREVMPVVRNGHSLHAANQELTGPDFRGVTDVTSILHAVCR